MSFIGSLLGAGQGSDWNTQNEDYNRQITNPVTMDQIGTAYDTSQNALAQQQSFLQALQAQNGIGNQNASYQAYAGLANGTGPNPALAQLNQTTAANVSNQAALMAGQRGTSQNSGLLARQAAMSGQNIQQQAVGQAATMAAQQQLSGIAGMAGIANTQVANQAGATTGLNQAAQSEQQNLLNAQGTTNNAIANQAGSQNAANANIQVQNSKAQQGLFGGLLGGSGAALSDERLKTNIKPADAKIQQFLDTAGAHEYDYKPEVQGLPGADSKTHTGPMAQELEKSELGKQMVIDTPVGKAVDFQRGLGTIISAQAQLNKRLDALEGKKPQHEKMMADGGPVMTDPNGLPAQAPNEASPAPSQSAIGKFLYGTAPGKADASATGGFMNNMQPNKQDGEAGQIQDNTKKATENLINNYVKPTIENLFAPGVDPKGLGSEFAGQAPTLGVPDTFQPPPVSGTGQLGVQNSMGFSNSGVGNSALGVDSGAADAAGAVSSDAAAAGAADAAATAEEAAAAGEAAAAAGEAGEAGEGIASMASLAAAAFGGRMEDLPRASNSKRKDMSKGGHVSGKAAVKGNSYANDTVKARLSPGEVVIPKSVMESEDPIANAAKFVGAIMAKSGSRGMKRSK